MFLKKAFFDMSKNLEKKELEKKKLEKQELEKLKEELKIADEKIKMIEK